MHVIQGAEACTFRGREPGAGSKEHGGIRKVKKKETGEKLFRFQNLEIWKKAIEIGDKLLDIADELERKRMYRFAEQVRAAGLSISNNISEGSGSFSNKEFAQFLNIARRSTFENANMVIVFERRSLINSQTRDVLLDDLEQECKMITGFIGNLKTK